MKWWWIKLARYALPQSSGLAAIFSLMLAGVGLSLLAPWPLKLIVDHVLIDKPLPAAISWVAQLPAAGSPGGLLFWLAAATIGLFLARRIVTVVQDYFHAGVGNRIVFHLASVLFDHLQRCSLLYHGKCRVGDLVQRVTADTGCVRELVLKVFVPLATSLAALPVTFFVMWKFNRPVAIFAIALTIPLAVVIRVLIRPMSERKYREWASHGELASLSEQTLTGIPVVQAFGREAWQEEQFRRIAGKTVAANLQSELSQHQFQVGVGAVSAAGASVVMVVGGMAVLKGALTVGDLLVLTAYFAALYSPIETLAYLSEAYASAAGGARRVFEVLDANDYRVDDDPDSEPWPQHETDGVGIELEDITFGYERDRPVLHNVSLTIRPGERVALVGRTGAGKSTLVSLIPRFFDVWSGTVRVAGKDIRQLQLASLRAHIAVVAQEPFLLPVTIAQNIAYGRPDAAEEDIVAAAIAAEADEFIRRLPKGYDTVIGERGATLSGGEKQRLSIARALLKNAPILILDEPTSAIDAATEFSLMEALDRLMEGRTTLIIAHRFSTIRRTDRVIVLDHGRIVEGGTHDELLSLQGRYHDMTQLQNALHHEAPGPSFAAP